MPTMTLTVDGPTGQRIAAAFGQYWHLTTPDGSPRNATIDEVREFLVRQLKSVVRQMEIAEIQAEAAGTVTEVPVTGSTT